MTEVWDLWFPGAGSTGLSFARAAVDRDAAGDRLLVHAAPPRLEVVVRDAADGTVVARGSDLERGQPGPMSALVREGDRVRLEDGWPTPDDLGRVVLLPGGEAGVLTAWEHAEDLSSWRWSVEFSNSTRT
jgi:hypothetical protein